MTTHTVTDELITSDAAADYFTRADRRVMIGLRAALELLRLPVPDYAIRRKPGRTPAGDVAAAFGADNPPPPFLTYQARKPSASPERVAFAKAATAARLGSTQ